MKYHWYSGYPGAYCVDCGACDPWEEIAGCPECVIACCPEEEGVIDERLCEEHVELMLAFGDFSCSAPINPNWTAGRI